MSENIHTEEFRVNGEELIAKIKGLIHEGNIRRIIIKTNNMTSDWMNARWLIWAPAFCSMMRFL